MKLWQRYVLREQTKVFLFFLFLSFTLYAILDYSAHMDDFFKERHLQVMDLLTYYLAHFVKRLDLLLPLSLLMATIHVLTKMNLRREWLVLELSGLPRRTILLPCLWLILAMTAVSYLNTEFFLPQALRGIDTFHAAHFKHSHRARRSELIHLLILRDQSKLIYQSYDPEKNALFDVLWIRSLNDIWRMKFLSADPNHPDAEFVDHLVRSPSHVLEKVQSERHWHFDDLKWHPKMGEKSFIPFEYRSLTQLARLALHSPHVTPYEIPKIWTQLYTKAAVPWLSLLAFLGIVPFCLGEMRKSRLALTYGIGLFGLFAFSMLLDAAVILGEHGTVRPLIAIGLPFLLVGGPLTWRFFRAI
jgi:lipopolysaccharide export system permease protein